MEVLEKPRSKQKKKREKKSVENVSGDKTEPTQSVSGCESIAKDFTKNFESPHTVKREKDGDDSSLIEAGESAETKENLIEISKLKSVSDETCNVTQVANKIEFEKPREMINQEENLDVPAVDNNYEAEKLVILNKEKENELDMKESMPQTKDNDCDIENAEEPALNTLDNILRKNKQIMSTTVNIDKINEYLAECSKKELNKPVEIHCTNEIKLPVTSIKPYTESQLLALYSNTELDTLEQFTADFVEYELKGFHMAQHPLYDLLATYLQNRNKMNANSLELEQSRREYADTQNQLWNVFSTVIKGHGQCQDGNTVTATQTYNKATFHRAAFETLARSLTKMRHLSTECHVLYSYTSDVCKLQIELYLQTLITCCISNAQLVRNAEVCLNLQATPVHLIPVLTELRICISIFFLFQRRLIRDAQFLKESRDWLSRLVAVLLRVANYQDHLFLLNHILRCPPGVGSWASTFIQAPLVITDSQDSPFASYEINHIVTILASVLMPIGKREKFLEELMHTKDAPGESLWVMVDSDGEEDEESCGISLRENDLVSILNQLPLDDLFRSLLLVKRRNGTDAFNGFEMSEHHILRFLAFSTILLKILQQGLCTYEQPRYNQFAKRLCRFIRHIVQYATDIWEFFKKNQKLDDAAMLQRLQIEYDAFFLRATFYLYTSQKMGAWQFLAVVPYNLVSRRCLWKIYYFLHDSDSLAESILDPIDTTDFSEKLWDPLVRSQFEEKLSTFEEAESYYLLNTFANMALSRRHEDMDFMEAATVDLLQVGYISDTTKETCSKNARILLAHITSKYPTLLSDILKIVAMNINTIGSLSLYLYEDLPLSIWQPTDADIEIISQLLKRHLVTSDGSRLARMIISRLNWEMTENLLFISYRIHCKIALLVAQIVDDEPGYAQWGWQTIFRLRLHISDKGLMDFTKIQELEQYDVLCRGVREQKLLACFLSVLMTSWGHLIPLICTKGLDQLMILQANQKHEAVLFVLNLIVPLFLNCQESLINSDKFQNILIGLLNADKGYMHLAKSLIVTHNPVLEQFGHMVENQIANCNWFNNVDSPRCIVRLWINSLVSVPNWNRDFGVMYLLDIIIRASFFYADALDVVVAILRELLQCVTPQGQSSTMSSLFKWVSPANASQGTLLINSSLSSCPWLAYIMIDLEHEEREKSTGLWKEILAQILKQKGKVNVDAAIKKAANLLKVPSFTSGSLCFYRWAQQALDTPVDHPLLPVLWQKFFSLYLYRIPVSSNIDRGCIGEKFFEGMINFTFQKKLKKRLQESVDYYQQRLDEATRNGTSRKMFYESCFRLFRAYSLWLEEPRLQEASLFLPGLPPQYEPQLLALIIQGSTTPWLEYLNYDEIKAEQQKSLKSWRCANYREKTNVNQPHPNAGGRIESEDPVERILRRLQSYDAPKEAPALRIAAPIVPNLDLSDKTALFKNLEPVFKTIVKFARDYNLSSSELKVFDCTYQELLPQLYKSVLCKIKKQVTCSGVAKTSHCSGPAIISLQLEEARINEKVQRLIEINREGYESLLKKFLQAPAQSLCLASVTLQQAINILQIKLKQEPSTSESGVELFYYVVSLLNEENTSYLPTKQLFTICLEKLGQSHIYGVEFETPRLLNKILQEPNLGVYLAPHFSPHNTGTANFLLMYSTISQEAGDRYDTIFALLSKFDVTHWLKSKEPKLGQRSKFIELVIKALQALGHEPAGASVQLHKLYRKHLMCIVSHQFPEHFGEVLVAMLKASNCGTDVGCIAINVWLDFLNFLSRPTEIKLNVPLRDQIRAYSQHQRLLNHRELLETAALLSKHFTQERFQYGLYGLYPKSRSYVEVFMVFIGMIGHALVISTLNTHPGLLGDKLSEMIWPCLRDLFSPWILPYWMQNMKENMANWIKQLADDRAVLLPWIPSDGPFATKTVHMFFECVMFVIQTLPACGNILSFVWHWYVSNFAHPAVKDHVLNVVHAQFLALPWHNFWPSIADLDLMFKLIEQYLPECHVFLGHIFMSVPWPSWLNNLSESTPNAVKSKVHQCLLHLLVKLSNEPNVRNNHTERAKALLVQAESFDWNLVDPPVYQQVIDWYVMSCDSLVLFKTDPLDLDFRVLHFLKVVSYYTKGAHSTQDSLEKQHIYIRSYVKLITVFASRHKSLIPSKEKDLNVVITNQLKSLEKYHNQAELNVLMESFMEVLNLPCVSNIILVAFEQWISVKCKDGVIINAVLAGLGNAVLEMETAASLYETTLTSYFVNDVSDTKQLSWNNVISVVRFNSVKQTELEQVLVNKGHLLTLHAYIMLKINKALDYKNLLNVCLEWLSNIKMSESIESKVPLIWFDVLTMALDYCEMDESCSGALLHKFAHVLLHSSEDKDGSKWGRGLLEAIGIVKQPAVSLPYKFLCRALASYVLAQLPEMKGNPQVVRRTPNAPFTVGQAGGNMECQKVLLKLDFGHKQGKIKDCAELALKQIQSPSNSLHNVVPFMTKLLNQFYMKPYLKDIG